MRTHRKKTKNHRLPVKSTIVIWLVLLFSLAAFGQSSIKFDIIGKSPSLIGTAFGGAMTQRSIVVRDWDDYHIYSFDAQEWSKLEFKDYRLKSLDGMSWMNTVYLPTFGKVITLSDELEILGLLKLDLGYIQIDGGAPVLGGAVVWKEKIYLFGGFIMVNMGNELSQQSQVNTVNKTRKPGRVLISSNKLIVFDPATLTYQELDSMPGSHFRLGAFVNDQLYAIGPVPGITPATDIICYNPLNPGWKNLGQFPVYVGAVAQDGDVLYLLGLDNHEGFLITLDTKTGLQKRFKTNVPWTQGLAFIRDHKLYYFAGMKENPKIREVFFRDPRWLSRTMYRLDLSTLSK